MSGLILPAGAGAPVGLVGVDKNPIPPTRLIEQLKSISERLDVIWQPMLENWAVVERWGPEDKRWELHRSGQIGNCYDVVTWCPRGQDPDTIGDFIKAELGKMDLARRPGNRNLLSRIRDMQAANAAVAASKVNLLTDATTEELRHEAKGILSKNGMGKIAKAEGVRVKYRKRR